jgi:hypothetical protein
LYCSMLTEPSGSHGGTVKRAVELPIMEVHRMTDMMSGVENAEDSKPATSLDEQLVSTLRIKIETSAGRIPARTTR